MEGLYLGTRIFPEFNSNVATFNGHLLHRPRELSNLAQEDCANDHANDARRFFCNRTFCVNVTDLITYWCTRTRARIGINSAVICFAIRRGRAVVGHILGVRINVVSTFFRDNDRRFLRIDFHRTGIDRYQDCNELVVYSSRDSTC